jgi:hypothetical protein
MSDNFDLSTCFLRALRRPFSYAKRRAIVIGKFVFIDGGDYYKTGEVVDKSGDEHYLVRIDGGDQSLLALYSLTEMAAVDGHGGKRWNSSTLERR